MSSPSVLFRTLVATALFDLALGCGQAPQTSADSADDSETGDEANDEETEGASATEEEDETDGSASESSGSPSSSSSAGESESEESSSTGEEDEESDSPSTSGATEGESDPTDTGTPADCTITVMSQELSEQIATVGIVEWSTDLGDLESATIEFGLDTSYGMEAPVDLEAENYRTLLLGMKEDSEYHFRIVASAGGETCTSDDYTIATDFVPNSVPRADVSTMNADARDGGFFVSGFYRGMTGTGGYAFILDGDGDIVWYYGTSNDVTAAKMTHDGQYMWIRNSNVGMGDAAGTLIRVAMDGSGELSAEDVSATHHDFTVLPDGTLGMLAYQSGGCDVILERAPDGTVTQIFDVEAAHGSSTCHTNSIHYHPEDETYTVSDLGGGGQDNDIYVKFTRSGEIVWVLGSGQGGPGAPFTG